jgi:hypothetical protein
MKKTFLGLITLTSVSVFAGTAELSSLKINNSRYCELVQNVLSNMSNNHVSFVSTCKYDGWSEAHILKTKLIFDGNYSQMPADTVSFPVRGSSINSSKELCNLAANAIGNLSTNSVSLVATCKYHGFEEVTKLSTKVIIH